jgi:hypothetical protein
MSPRLLLCDQELIDYSGEHLLYEIQMFRFVASKVPTLTAGVDLSAFLEFFAIHLRNLTDFFYDQKPLPDDVVAADFYDDPRKWNASISPSLATAQIRANKEISHLTLKRKAGMDPGKPWPVLDLYREIRAVAKVFSAGASPNKLHPKVVEFINLFSTPMAGVLLDLTYGPMTNTTTSVVGTAVFSVGEGEI